MRATDVAYAELGEVEKSVVLLDNDALDPSSNPSQDEDDRRIIKTIKKPIVEIMCSQHNPVCSAKILAMYICLLLTNQVVLERKKQAKREQTRKDVLALAPEARIKIRNASGVCEVTVASVNEGRESVTVIWTDGYASSNMLHRPNLTRFCWFLGCGETFLGEALSGARLLKEPSSSVPRPKLALVRSYCLSHEHC